MPVRRRPATAALLALLFTTSACSGASPEAADSGVASTAASAPGSSVSSPTASVSSAAAASSSSSSGASSSAAGSSGPPAPVTGKPGSITIGASGDLIVHPAITAMAKRAAGGSGYRFDQFFAPVASTIAAADVSICQMENPLSSNDTDMARELSFNAPHEFATTVKNLGFDGCSTANNHTYDRGLAGMRSTRAVLAANGLKAAGPGGSADEQGQPVFYEAKGFKVAQLSYTYSISNLLDDMTTVPTDAPWTASAMWARKKASGIEADARSARAAGADLVVVSMHWGNQYEPVNASQRTLAKELLTSGQIDWIIGNHPHVVQPCEKIDGRYVTYSLGNFFSGQQAAYLPGTADALYTDVTFTRDAAGKITQSMTYRPTYQDQATRVVELATPAQHAESYRKTTATMSELGCDASIAK